MLVRTEHGWGEAGTLTRCLLLVFKCHVIFGDKVVFYDITYGNPINKLHGLLLWDNLEHQQWGQRIEEKVGGEISGHGQNNKFDALMLFAPHFE